MPQYVLGFIRIVKLLDHPPTGTNDELSGHLSAGDLFGGGLWQTAIAGSEPLQHGRPIRGGHIQEQERNSL